MRVVGMVLAVGVAVMFPSTAKADPIRVQAGAVTSTLGHANRDHQFN